MTSVSSHRDWLAKTTRHQQGAQALPLGERGVWPQRTLSTGVSLTRAEAGVKPVALNAGALPQRWRRCTL